MIGVNHPPSSSQGRSLHDKHQELVSRMSTFQSVHQVPTKFHSSSPDYGDGSSADVSKEHISQHPSVAVAPHSGWVDDYGDDDMEVEPTMSHHNLERGTAVPVPAATARMGDAPPPYTRSRSPRRPVRRNGVTWADDMDVQDEESYPPRRPSNASWEDYMDDDTQDDGSYPTPPGSGRSNQPHVAPALLNFLSNTKKPFQPPPPPPEKRRRTQGNSPSSAYASSNVSNSSSSGVSSASSRQPRRSSLTGGVTQNLPLPPLRNSSKPAKSSRPPPRSNSNNSLDGLLSSATASRPPSKYSSNNSLDGLMMMNVATVSRPLSRSNSSDGLLGLAEPAIASPRRQPMVITRELKTAQRFPPPPPRRPTQPPKRRNSFHPGSATIPMSDESYPPQPIRRHANKSNSFHGGSSATVLSEESRPPPQQPARQYAIRRNSFHSGSGATVLSDESHPPPQRSARQHPKTSVSFHESCPTLLSEGSYPQPQRRAREHTGRRSSSRSSGITAMSDETMLTPPRRAKQHASRSVSFHCENSATLVSDESRLPPQRPSRQHPKVGSASFHNVSGVTLLSDESEVADVASAHEAAKQPNSTQGDMSRIDFVGYRDDYALGEAARSLSHMVAVPTLQKANEAVSRLSTHDYAFVRRSDGRFSYAILAFYSNDGEEMSFVLSKAGRTKTIKRNQWGQSVRLVSNYDICNVEGSSVPGTEYTPIQEQGGAHVQSNDIAKSTQDLQAYVDKLRTGGLWVPEAIEFDDTGGDHDSVSCLSLRSARSALKARKQGMVPQGPQVRRSAGGIEV